MRLVYNRGGRKGLSSYKGKAQNAKTSKDYGGKRGLVRVGKKKR